MKLRIFLFMIAIACALGLSMTKTGAQDKAKPSAAPTAAEMQDMMKKWMETAKPGEGHKLLEPLVGKWDTVTRMWMAAEQPPAESKGTSEAKWTLDGRFLIEEATGQMMGMPYKSISFMGFDNYKKKYVFSYVDNFGTALYTGEGKLDLSKQVLTAFGKMDDPTMGEIDKPVKYVTRFISKDKHIFEIYDEVGSPNEFKAVEIVSTRKP